MTSPIMLDENLIIELYQDGKSMSYISREFNCSTAPIKRILKENSIEIRKIKQDIDPEKIKIMYENGWSFEKIGKHFGVTHKIIADKYKKIGGNPRTISESMIIHSNSKLKNKKWLYNQYHILNKSALQIAKELEVSNTSVQDWLEKHGFKKEQFQFDEVEIIKMYTKGNPSPEITEKFGVSQNIIYRILKQNNIKTHHKKIMKSNEKLLDKKYLIQEYKIKKKSMKEIGEELNCGAATVGTYLKKHGIEINKLKDYFDIGKLKGKHGADNPKFGKEPYHGKGQWVNLNGKWHYFRSSWEVKVAKYLFLNGYNFKYEEVRFDLGSTTYKPDFFLYDDNDELLAIIEVKGWMHDRHARKSMLFQELYPDIPYYVWDKEIYKVIEQEVA